MSSLCFLHYSGIRLLLRMHLLYFRHKWCRDACSLPQLTLVGQSVGGDTAFCCHTSDQMHPGNVPGSYQVLSASSCENLYIVLTEISSRQLQFACAHSHGTATWKPTHNWPAIMALLQLHAFNSRGCTKLVQPCMVGGRSEGAPRYFLRPPTPQACTSASYAKRTAAMLGATCSTYHSVSSPAVAHRPDAAAYIGHWGIWALTCQCP